MGSHPRDSESCLAIGEQADAPDCDRLPADWGGSGVSQRLARHWSGAKEASPSAG